MSNIFGGVKPSSPNTGESVTPDMDQVEMVRIQQKLERMGYQLDTLAHRMDEVMRILMEIKTKK